VLVVSVVLTAISIPLALIYTLTYGL